MSCALHSRTHPDREEGRTHPLLREGAISHLAGRPRAKGHALVMISGSEPAPPRSHHAGKLAAKARPPRATLMALCAARRVSVRRRVWASIRLHEYREYQAIASIASIASIKLRTRLCILLSLCILYRHEKLGPPLWAEAVRAREAWASVSTRSWSKHEKPGPGQSRVSTRSLALGTWHEFRVSTRSLGTSLECVGLCCVDLLISKCVDR